MRKVKSRDTGLEQKVRSALWRKGYRFRKNETSLPGTPDIAFPGAKIAVFIDSCFWHGCPNHLRKPKSNTEYWEKKMARNRKRDAKVNREYERIEWKAIRIWEHSIRESFDETLQDLTDVLDNRYGGRLFLRNSTRS